MSYQTSNNNKTYFSMLHWKMLVIFIISPILYTCHNNAPVDDQIVARVGTKKLYLSDISAVIPKEAGREDSMIMADDYIRKWIKRELMVRKAEENLTAEQKNVTRELEEYRNSLIIYRYKNEMIAQKMDTTVSYNQILEYYSNNTGNFRLKNNLVKAIFLKIPAEFAHPEELKQLCKNETGEGIIELRDYCIQYAKSFDIFTDRWVDFDVVLKNIPENVENPKQFLIQNDIIEMKDSSYYYLVTIYDYKLKNEQAPIEYVQDDIKNLILNKRKIDFLKEVENKVYSEGIRKNNFEIFDKKNEAE
jgi:hypothetical protein